MLLTTRMGKAAPYTQNLGLHTNAANKSNKSNNNKIYSEQQEDDDSAGSSDVISIPSEDSESCQPETAVAIHNTLISTKFSSSNIGLTRPPLTTRLQPTYSIAEVFVKPRNNVANNLASSSSNSLVKSLATRLQRGTVYLKDTVAKALNVNASSNAPPPTKLDSVKISSIGGKAIVTATHSGHSGISEFPSKAMPATAAVPVAITVNNSKTVHNGAMATITKLQNTCSSRYVVPTESFLKKYTVQPTAFHRSEEMRKRTDSTDSFSSEMCHFKPIRTAPIASMKGGNKWRNRDIKRPIAIRPSTQRDCVDSLNEFKPKKCYVLISAHRHLSAFASLREVEPAAAKLATRKSRRKRPATAAKACRVTKKRTPSKKTDNQVIRDSIKPQAERKRKQPTIVESTKAKVVRRTPPLTRRRANQMQIKL